MESKIIQNKKSKSIKIKKYRYIKEETEILNNIDLPLKRLKLKDKINLLEKAEYINSEK